MILSGSREWGGDRLGSVGWQKEDELRVSAQIVAKLIARHVIGLEGDVSKRQRSAVRPPGLVIVQGGARGFDETTATVTRIYAGGLRRRGRIDLRKVWVEPELADGLWLETFMADWDHEGKAAGGLRNQRMLDAGADHVIACFAHGRPYGPDVRGGTNDMVRRAAAAGVPVDIYVADERRWRKP